MSVSMLILSLLLTGQVSLDDRYGTPATDPVETAPARNVAPPSSFGAPVSIPAKNSVKPPPSVSSPAGTSSQPPRQMPTMTEGDYGYGAPATSGSPPTSSQLNLPRPPASSPSRQSIGSRAPITAQTADAAGTSKARSMMRAILTAPSGAKLAGRPVSLSEVVSSASSRQEQSRRIDAYWDLCSAVADYYLGVREQDELQRLRGAVSSVGPVWQEAESELGVRIATSLRAAVASQYRLASLMGDSGNSGLPLPSDLPHCGDYYARYEQVFAGRESMEAKELSELLPMRYEELVDSTAAVTRAEENLAAVASQRGDGSAQLRALELLAMRRRAFVQVARDYNRRIARYTELSTPGEIGSERVLSMLIKRDGVPNTATRPGSYAPPLNRQSQVPANDPSHTFAEGWESIKSAAAEVPVGTDASGEEVRQAAVEEELETETRKPEARRERSLLVPRSP